MKERIRKQFTVIRDNVKRMQSISMKNVKEEMPPMKKKLKNLCLLPFPQGTPSHTTSASTTRAAFTTWAACTSIGTPAGLPGPPGAGNATLATVRAASNADQYCALVPCGNASAHGKYKIAAIILMTN